MSKTVLKTKHMTSSWCWALSEYLISSRQPTKLEVADLDIMKPCKKSSDVSTEDDVIHDQE